MIEKKEKELEEVRTNTTELASTTPPSEQEAFSETHPALTTVTTEIQTAIKPALEIQEKREKEKALELINTWEVLKPSDKATLITRIKALNEEQLDALNLDWDTIKNNLEKDERPARMTLFALGLIANIGLSAKALQGINFNKNIIEFKDFTFLLKRLQILKNQVPKNQYEKFGPILWANEEKERSEYYAKLMNIPTHIINALGMENLIKEKFTHPIAERALLKVFYLNKSIAQTPYITARLSQFKYEDLIEAIQQHINLNSTFKYGKKRVNETPNKDIAIFLQVLGELTDQEFKALGGPAGIIEVINPPLLQATHKENILSEIDRLIAIINSDPKSKAHGLEVLKDLIRLIPEESKAMDTESSENMIRIITYLSKLIQGNTPVKNANLKKVIQLLDSFLNPLASRGYSSLGVNDHGNIYKDILKSGEKAADINQERVACFDPKSPHYLHSIEPAHLNQEGEVRKIFWIRKPLMNHFAQEFSPENTSPQDESFYRTCSNFPEALDSQLHELTVKDIQFLGEGQGKYIFELYQDSFPDSKTVKKALAPVIPLITKEENKHKIRGLIEWLRADEVEESHKTQALFLIESLGKLGAADRFWSKKDADEENNSDSGSGVAFIRRKAA
jgi:hypothetical protein